MGDDNQNIKTTAEDLAVERAEQQFADPSALNMQFLQSTLNATQFEGLSPNSGFATSTAKGFVPSPSQSAGGVSPAFSGAGLLGAVAAADMGSASSAMGIAAQTASAAPVTFGKSEVGDSATLAGLGNKALAESSKLSALSNQNALPKPMVNADGSMVPLSPEFAQLMAMLESTGDSVNPDDALMSLIGGLDQSPSPENLQAAIESVMDQIGLLNSTFEPLFDNLSGDVQSEVASQTGMPSTDLGLAILEDAGSVSTALTDLVGTIDVGANPQLDSLLNLDSNFDDIASLVGSLPDLDLSPVTEPVVDVIGGIVDPVIDPVTDIVDGVVDPIVDPVIDIVDGVVDPIVDPVIDIVDGVVDPIVDPVIDIVDGVVDPIVDPVIDIVDGVVDPIVDPVVDLVDGIVDPIEGVGLLSGLSTSSSESDVGLLDSLSSGISSSAGSEGGALDGLLGPLDPNK